MDFFITTYRQNKLNIFKNKDQHFWYTIFFSFSSKTKDVGRPCQATAERDGDDVNRLQ